MSSLRTLLVGPESWRSLTKPLILSLADVVGEAGTPSDGIAKTLEAQPDAVIIGWETDVAPSIRTAEAILTCQPTCAVILMGPPLDPAGLTRAMQAGIREVLCSPAQLTEALGRAITFLERLRKAQTGTLKSPTGKIVVVHAPRGGCGKSTLSASLAIALKQITQETVSLLDLEPQFGSLDLFFNLPVRASVADVARMGAGADSEALQTAFASHSSGVRLLPAAPTPEEAELVTAETVGWTLEALKAQGGWTVVDTGSQLTESILRALELADKIVVPLTMDMASLRALQQAMRLWADLGIDCEKIEVAGYQQSSEIGSEAVERVLKRPLRHRLGWDQEAALTAINTGVPLISSVPNGAYARSVRDIVAGYAGTRERALVPVNAASNPLASLWGAVRRMINVPTQSA